MIYLDNSATTKPYTEVLETFTTVSTQFFGNPSSMHVLGMESEKVLERAREAIASLLRVEPREILFTSGGTEGNNLAIKGIAFAHQKRGKHLITSKVEHASILEAFKQLEQLGFDVTYLPVDNNGRVSLQVLQEEIRNDTILVSLHHVNNETGAIQPIEEVGALLTNYPKILFHVDHVQGLTKVPLDFKHAKLDLCTISAHKIHGLKGTGALYIRQGVMLSPLFHGGSQEMDMRAGTENVAGIAAFAKALRISMERSKDNLPQMLELKKIIFEKLLSIQGVCLNSNLEYAAPHIINFSVPTVRPEIIISALAQKQMYLSTKSACSSKLTEPSHVLMAMNLGEKRAESAVRVSLSFDTNAADIERFILELKQIIAELLMITR